jgi:hypothetical protein
LWRLDKTRRREIVIQSVRDLVTDPLSVIQKILMQMSIKM